MVFAVLNIAGLIIGGFSILVGGFGIANIMFVSVKERTNIIGIQKSLGAKNYFILLQFLIESISLPDGRDYRPLHGLSEPQLLLRRPSIFRSCWILKILLSVLALRSLSGSFQVLFRLILLPGWIRLKLYGPIKLIELVD